MKAPRGLLSVVAALAVVSAFAASPKKQAFGPLNFGDSPDEQKAAMIKITSSIPRTHSTMTAEDAAKNLVVTGSKFPGHLSSKYSKVAANLGFTQQPALTTIHFESEQLGAADYQTTTKQAWEVFRDICESKFGRAVSLEPMPPIEKFGTKSETIATDVWNVNGLTVTLGMHLMAVPNNPHYTAIIIVETTAAPTVTTR